MVTSTTVTPQRGSAPPFSISENDALYTLPTYMYTTGRFTDQGLGPVRNFPLHQTTRPSRYSTITTEPSQTSLVKAQTRTTIAALMTTQGSNSILQQGRRNRSGRPGKCRTNQSTYVLMPRWGYSSSFIIACWTCSPKFKTSC